MEDGFAVIFTCVSVYFPLDQQTLEFYRVSQQIGPHMAVFKHTLGVKNCLCSTLKKFVDLLVLNTD